MDRNQYPLKERDNLSFRHSLDLSECDSMSSGQGNRDIRTSASNLVDPAEDDDITVDTVTTYHTISIPGVQKSPSKGRISQCIEDFRIPNAAFELSMSLLIPVLVWLAMFVIVGSENMPGGSVFVIVFLEFGGRILGYLVSLIKLPPMVGMLGLGIAIRNVPYIDFGKYLNPAVSSPIRQISLAIILTRAGLGLDLDVLIKLKWLVARLAFFPTLIEAVVTALMVHFLIGFPWLWSLLVGCVVAAVSPAVIVPRILALKEEAYGEEKGICNLILASASLDNIVAIALFGVTVGFTFSNKSLTMTILQGPLEIILGISAGLAWGFVAGMIFSPSTTPDNDRTLLKILVVLIGSISSVLGFQRLGYSGAGALGCLISAFTTACFWRKRDVMTHDFEIIKWVFTFLWKLFEPLLFGVIGCQIVIATLDTKVLILGLACLAVGAMVRFLTTYLMVCGTGLNLKEKLFVAISWVPKATVQAAIGPIALDLGRTSGNKEFEELGQQVLTLAVLVILLTAPLGELAVILSGPRFLTKKLN